MNVCHVIWSSNRPEYLLPTLDSLKRVDYGKHNVHKIFIDDFPVDRDDNYIKNIASENEYKEIILHKKNKGITKNFTFTHTLLKYRTFDYIFHTEDDIYLKYDINIDELIDIHNSDPNIVGVCLTRQPWYESEFNISSNNLTGRNIGRNGISLDKGEVKYGNYLYEFQTSYFATMAILYSNKICSVDRFGDYNISESTLMHDLKQINKQSYVAALKTIDGDNIIDHIGDTSKGVLLSEERDPGYETMHRTSDKLYNSKTGEILKDI